jgi:glycolate dehydrogenase FAD-linked subunit
MDGVLRRQLVAIVGAAGLGSDGVVRAATVVQLEAVLVACSAAGVTVAPDGSAPAGGADVLISADRLDAIQVDASSLLLRAGAALSWVAISEAAGALHLAVTGLPSLRSDRCGTSVALGEISHRALAGVDLLTPRGELISAGGRTLKDVVGYDLAGLALGSGDRLGLIVSVTLRLEPLAARTPAEPGPGPWRGDHEIAVAVAAAFTG